MSAPGPPGEWRRLDPRMLLVGPLGALRQFAVPAVIAAVGLSSSAGFDPLFVLGTALVVMAVGTVPWLTVRYRVTATQFQRRSGLLNRQQVTAPLERVRSVDLESRVLHRLLGLATVKVGTGVDETTIELDALGRREAEELRRVLLARLVATNPGAAVPAEDAGPDRGPEPGAAFGEPEPEVLAVLDWSWLRFAPLSLARLAVVAGAVGLLTQLVDDLPLDYERVARDTWDRVTDVVLPLLVVTVLVGSVGFWLVVSMLGYALQWGGMRLVRTAGSIRLTAGLLTTRSTSVEEARVRGVEISEPVLMRPFEGAELSTLSTGVDRGTTRVMPPSPLAEDLRVAAALLGDPRPLSVALVPHGPAARRRAHVRQQWDLLVHGAAAAGVTAWQGWGWWVVAAVLLVGAVLNAGLAEVEYRNLGHALTEDHLVSGSGVLTRRRTVLERDGIIGWVLRQSWFQRRAGLVTLVATTAAGSESVEIRDVRHEVAVGVARAATPTAVEDFLLSPG